ncbi:hypothetical protein D3C75_1295230 [compost metagenome]
MATDHRAAKLTASGLIELKKALFDELDTALLPKGRFVRALLPSFVRKGALDPPASALQTRHGLVPEAKHAFSNFTKPEKEAFATG